MSVKSYIVLGLFVCATVGALSPPSYARNESSIILAQNESGEKRSFLGRLFNRSDKTSSAKPLFLDKHRGIRSERQGKPYSYSRRKQPATSSRYEADRAWDAFMKERDKNIAVLVNWRRGAQQREKAREEAMIAEFKQKREDKVPVGKGKKMSNKKMVYDPKKVRYYNSNASRDDNSVGHDDSANTDTSSGRKRPRIFNTR